MSEAWIDTNEVLYAEIHQIDVITKMVRIYLIHFANSN